MKSEQEIRSAHDLLAKVARELPAVRVGMGKDPESAEEVAMIIKPLYDVLCWVLDHQGSCFEDLLPNAELLAEMIDRAKAVTPRERVQ